MAAKKKAAKRQAPSSEKLRNENRRLREQLREMEHACNRAGFVVKRK